MFIDLDRVPPSLEGGEVLDRTISIQSLSGEPGWDQEDFELVADVELSGRLERIELEGADRRVKRGQHDRPAKTGPGAQEDTYRLKGRMRTRIEVDCVRCLERVSLDLDEELDLLYLPQSRNVAPPEGGGDAKPPRDDDALPERGLDSEELAVSFYRDGRLDLAQMLREQIVLALPMKVLCAEACRGLCPECGVNRNLSTCDCERDETDPRWAELSKLKARLGS